MELIVLSEYLMHRITEITPSGDPIASIRYILYTGKELLRGAALFHLVKNGSKSRNCSVFIVFLNKSAVLLHYCLF